jgi:hypothetical protein
MTEITATEFMPHPDPDVPALLGTAEQGGISEDTKRRALLQIMPPTEADFVLARRCLTVRPNGRPKRSRVAKQLLPWLNAYEAGWRAAS